MALLVPEIEIFNTLKAILVYIKFDFENRANEQDTLLYKLCGSNVLQRYNFFEQAKTVFLKKEDDPRLLDVNMFFNLERATIPTMHITLPAEQPDKDGIGIDEGFKDYEEINELGDETQSQTTPVYTRRFATQYNIIITSDNSNEVVLIYHIIRAILIPMFDSLNATGLDNCKLSGRDIQNMNTIVPDHIFMRTIGLSLEYEVSVESLFPKDVIDKIIYEGTVLKDPPSGDELPQNPITVVP